MKKDALNLNNEPHKPKRFQKMRKALKGISISMNKASKNPRKYIDTQDMDIQDKKGIVV